MNMSYCRFTNTLIDFNDCAATLREPNAKDKLSKDETRAAKDLLISALNLLIDVVESADDCSALEDLDDYFLEQFVDRFNETCDRR